MRPILLAQTTLIYGYGEIVRRLPLVSGTRSYVVPTEDSECIGIIDQSEKIRTSGPCLPKANRGIIKKTHQVILGN